MPSHHKNNRGSMYTNSAYYLLFTKKCKYFFSSWTLDIPQRPYYPNNAFQKKISRLSGLSLMHVLLPSTREPVFVLKGVEY